MKTVASVGLKPMPKSAEQLIFRARALIGPYKHWAVGAWEVNRTDFSKKTGNPVGPTYKCWCADGALIVAAGLDPNDTLVRAGDSSTPALDLARKLVALAMRKVTYYSGQTDVAFVVKGNDAESVRNESHHHHRRVVKAFDRAIAAAKILGV
jgi:hypothetical protein